MKLLGIGDNVFDHYRWRKELYPGGNSVNVPVLARRYDGSETGYIGLIADDREGRHFLKALDEEGLDVSRVRMMHGVTARNYIEIDEQGDRHFVGNNGRETAQYQSEGQHDVPPPRAHRGYQQDGPGQRQHGLVAVGQRYGAPYHPSQGYAGREQ